MATQNEMEDYGSDERPIPYVLTDEAYAALANYKAAELVHGTDATYEPEDTDGAQ
jgi:hypothetical protein